MANKLHTASSSTSRFTARSRILLFTLSLFAFSLIFLFFSLSTSSTSPGRPHSKPSLPRPETSFDASLEHFLTRNPKVGDDTVSFSSDDDVKELEERVFLKDSDRFYNEGEDTMSYPLDLPIRVYVYQMPSKFTYDLLWLFRNTYRDTFNLTSNGSPVHRLIEQHSIDYWLWADLIAPESERLLKNVIRVGRQEEADLFYIPFFTTISFFLLEKQQCKSLYRVML